MADHGGHCFDIFPELCNFCVSCYGAANKLSWNPNKNVFWVKVLFHSFVFDEQLWLRHLKQPWLCWCCSRSSCQHTLRMCETSWRRTCTSCGQWPRLTRGGHMERSVPQLPSHYLQSTQSLFRSGCMERPVPQGVSTLFTMYTVFSGVAVLGWLYGEVCTSGVFTLFTVYTVFFSGGHMEKPVPHVSSHYLQCARSLCKL